MFEKVSCQSLDDLWEVYSQKWPVVMVMTVKVNLRHRIEKLGVELEEGELTTLQLDLRKNSRRTTF